MTHREGLHNMLRHTFSCDAKDCKQTTDTLDHPALPHEWGVVNLQSVHENKTVECSGHLCPDHMRLFADIAGDNGWFVGQAKVKSSPYSKKRA